MKAKLTSLIVAAVLGLSITAVAPAASADEVKMVGAITKIKVAPDGKSATAVLKDNKTGTSVTINITDDLTLDKFKDKRIVEGDEIRTKFDNAGGKNLSQSFKKTAGC
jgi:hypothetical protein